MPHLLTPPHVYGWQHIVYLLVFLIPAAGTLALIKLKVKSEKTNTIIMKCVGGLLFATVAVNRISLIEFYGSTLALIPNTFCGITNLLFGLWAIFGKKNSLPFHFFVYAGFWGGVVNLFYPTYLGQNESFMYLPTITGLLHHSFAFYLAILLLMTGYVKPELKRFYAFPVGMSFVMVYGVFLLDVSNQTIPDGAMYIFKAVVPGTFLTWYVVYPAMILASLGLLCLWEKVICPRYILKKTQQTA